MAWYVHYARVLIRPRFSHGVSHIVLNKIVILSVTAAFYIDKFCLSSTLVKWYFLCMQMMC
jgi:hypothetical protein